MDPKIVTAKSLMAMFEEVYETPSSESLPASLELDSGSVVEALASGSQPDNLPSTIEFSDAEGDSFESWKDRPRRGLHRQDAFRDTPSESGEGTFVYFCELL